MELKNNQKPSFFYFWSGSSSILAKSGYVVEVEGDFVEEPFVESFLLMLFPNSFKDTIDIAVFESALKEMKIWWN